MSHLDDGQITALLDGELPPDATRQARDHLALCGECNAKFEEARAYFDEANRLVRVLDVPVKAVSTPLVLYPAPGAAPRRASHFRHFAWAASLLLAIGLGYYGNELRTRDRRDALDSMQPTASLQAEPSAPATAAPAAGVAGARTDAAAATALAKDSRPAAQKVEQDRAPPEVSAQTGDKELARADGVPESTTSAGGAAVALERQPPAPAAAPAVGNLAATAGQARREDSPALRAAKPADSRDVSAANALAEKRPAEAYASASQGEKISLEDAKQSLGGWIHLIDGLTPHRVERLEGRQMAGASAEATLIRVVYVETPGNELWLDQQRGMAGAASDTVLLHNTDGGLSLQWAAPPDSWLSLTGHVSEDSLRILAHRVE